MITTHKLQSSYNLDFFDSAGLNNYSYLMYYNYLVNIAESRFKYDNLPETCDPRYLEQTLVRKGCAGFFYDGDVGLVTLPYVLVGQYNIYGYPTIVKGYSDYNNLYLPGDKTNFVPIYNTYSQDNTTNICRYYALKLYEIDRTIDVNIGSQKTPILIVTEEKQRLTMENVYKQYKGNAPVITAKKGVFDPDSVQVLKTDAPFTSPAMYDLKSNIINEFLTRMGISNVTVNKKERLISDEVNRAQGGVFASRKVYLKPRQEAIDKVNRKFGTEITIEFDEEVIDKVYMDTGYIEEVSDG